MTSDARIEEIYGFIHDYIEEHGFSPSLREISTGCFTSATNVVRYLDKLQMDGRVTREWRVPRSIVLLDADDTS